MNRLHFGGEFELLQGRQRSLPQYTQYDQQAVGPLSVGHTYSNLVTTSPGHIDTWSQLVTLIIIYHSDTPLRSQSHLVTNCFLVTAGHMVTAGDSGHLLALSKEYYPIASPVLRTPSVAPKITKQRGCSLQEEISHSVFFCVCVFSTNLVVSLFRLASDKEVFFGLEIPHQGRDISPDRKTDARRLLYR